MIDQSELENLTVGEKLKIVTSLWDQIAESEQSLRIPDTVLDDADTRVAEMVENPAAALTEEDVWRRADELR